jgi:lysine 2,3-aminomutase
MSALDSHGVRRDDLDEVAARYAVALTPVLNELIDAEAGCGPVSRQFLPDARELDADASEFDDPIGDNVHSPVPGVVHRYPDRVLLMPTRVCAAYCRFCFRREVVGKSQNGLLGDAELQRALAYIRAHEEIWEVILSGGDPLILSARRLAAILAALREIRHVRIVRVHTRVPLVAPGQVSDELVSVLRRAAPLFVVLHANHEDEFTADGEAACARLVDAGIPMLGQSVLLKDVNDDAESLERLMRRFVENRIKPYYLHHADRANGTAHFRTDIDVGRGLVDNLRGRVSGICQPTYVLDIPGGHGKSPIGPNRVRERSGGEVEVRDADGRWHRYPPT